jgi:hypothetical protein
VSAANRPLLGFFYDPASQLAFWSLQEPIADADKVLLDLDGDAGGGDGNGVSDFAATPPNLLDGNWTNGGDTFPSGDGAAGGDFRFRINIMPGDANGDGTTNVSDLGILSTHFNRSPRGPHDGDFTGDALVNVSDLGILASHFNKVLPAGNPAAALSRARPRFVVPAAAARPAVRAAVALFGTAAIRRADEGESLID